MNAWKAIAALAVAALAITLLSTGAVELNPDVMSEGVATTIDELTTDDRGGISTERAPTAGGQIQTTQSNRVRYVDPGFPVDDFERMLADHINEERRRAARQKLDYDPQLAAIAEYHSRDMAERDYFSHTAPGGEDLRDRMAQFNYACRIAVGDGRYTTGGENLYRTWYRTNVQYGFGDEFYDSQGELAAAVTWGWMRSDDHRLTILRDYWQHHGVGAVFVESGGDTMVLITHVFC